MRARLLMLLAVPLILLMGPLIAHARQRSDPTQSPGIGIRPDGSRDLLSAATTRQRSGEWTNPDPEPPPKACLDVSPGSASIAPKPDAIDPITLTVLKSWVSGAWQLAFSWTGSSGPFTVSSSPTPSFQNGVQTLQQGTSSTGLTQNADTSKNLECFEVTDASVVSEPVQGMGYDPTPAPTPPTFASAFYWWGQDATLSANYLDPIPQNNVTFFYELPIRAHLATPIGNGYASDATFTIPDDSRSAYMYIQAHGRTSPPTSVQYLRLSPPNIGPYTSIRGVSYARTTGKVWVAANGLVQEADVFLRTPATGFQFTDATKPYISRETTDGRILYVDGVSGVSSIWQVDVSSGTRSLYALTTDSQFTRLIRPVGLAVDPDGSACYVADANQSRVVKIPANNGSNIVDTWGNRSFSFLDPCGIDANIGHQVVLGTSSWQTWIISGQYSSTFQYNTNSAPNCLEIDRDVATASWFPWVYSDAAFCEGFNQHTFTTPGGGTANPRYHGAQVWADTTGVLVLTPDWTYAVYHHYPQKVIINNMGQPQVYPSPWQSQDRVIRLDMTGWPSAPLRLRLIDPSDVSGYAPDGGFPSQYGSPVAPYEANDDYGPADPVTNTDYGLTFSSDGSGATTTPLIGYPDSNFNLTVYLKVPTRYSGDNYEVEVTKCALGSPPTPLPQRIAFLSSAYTSWKRVWVERDHMFRRGGVLHDNAAKDDTFVVLYKHPNDTDRLDNLVEGDKIAIFDTGDATGGSFEGAHDEAYIAPGGINPNYGSPPPGAPHQVRIDLVTTRSGSTPYTLKRGYTASPANAATYWPDFGNATGKSAGVGVINSNDGLIYDTASNQINGTGSAFYDADMRGNQQPFDDAYVEFYALRSGMGAVPFLPRAFFDDSAYGWANAIYFGIKWFANYTPPNNYFQLMGTSSETSIDSQTSSANNLSQIMVQNIFDYGDPQPQKTYRCQSATNHEEGHWFDVNPDNCPGHDSRSAWCNGNGCTDSCLMDPARNRTDNVDRFDTQCLATGEPNSGQVQCQPLPAPPQSWVIGDGAIRRETDPK